MPSEYPSFTGPVTLRRRLARFLLDWMSAPLLRMVHASGTVAHLLHMATQELRARYDLKTSDAEAVARRILHEAPVEVRKDGLGDHFSGELRSPERVRAHLDAVLQARGLSQAPPA